MGLVDQLPLLGDGLGQSPLEGFDLRDPGAGGGRGLPGGAHTRGKGGPVSESSLGPLADIRAPESGPSGGANMYSRSAGNFANRQPKVRCFAGETGLTATHAAQAHGLPRPWAWVWVWAGVVCEDFSTPCGRASPAPLRPHRTPSREIDRHLICAFPGPCVLSPGTAVKIMGGTNTDIFPLFLNWRMLTIFLNDRSEGGGWEPPSGILKSAPFVGQEGAPPIYAGCRVTVGRRGVPSSRSRLPPHLTRRM